MAAGAIFWAPLGGNETDLQLIIIEHGITLQGAGQVTLSDTSLNVIEGTSSDVTLTNVDNTISGVRRVTSGLFPVALIVPSLTSVICPFPRWPARQGGGHPVFSPASLVWN